MSDQDDSYAWAIDVCIESTGTDPAELLEQLMADEHCAAFGPVHHLLVGAALLACFRTIQFGDSAEGREQLQRDLVELGLRSANVPGAACARWGVCGAAASTGMAYAIIRENAPLKEEGWSEGQHMVAAILEDIASAGAPRCCKRDSRIAVRDAVKYFNALLGDAGEMTLPASDPVCAVFDKNTVCLHTKCPYFPRSKQESTH